ncbi:MAG: metalloregulator ArsR/SmtB family transcription factor [Planctomycetota bacterium]
MPRAAATESVFQSIADPTRRGILDLLKEGERPASELGAPFQMSQPALSQHLRILRDANLVSVRAKGRQRIYRLNPEPLQELYDWVTHYQEFWHDKLRALGAHLDTKARNNKRSR